MDALSQIPLTMCTMKSAIAAGTTTTLSTTGTTLYCIKGKAYSTAAKTNSASPTTDATTASAFVAQAIGEGCVYVIGLDSSGAFKVSQGSRVTLDSAGNFRDLPQFPPIPDTVCPIGYYLVQLAPATATTPAVATWTFGTNNNSSVTGVTYTFVSVMTLPDRPQAS